MSDRYYKKVIKGSNDEKFEEKSKYKDKEECEMSDKHKKHDDKCHDKCHDKCDDKCKHKEEKSIFTEFDVSESSRIVFPTTPGGGTIVPGTGTPISIDTLAQVQIDVDDFDDQVLLQGTVEWTPGDISLIADIIAGLVVLGVSLPLGIQATFRIWRSSHHSPFVPIFETTDTSTVDALDILSLIGAAPLTLSFSTVTTSFHWVDKDPSCGINRYFLTLDLALTTDPTITTLGGVTGLLSSFLPTLTSTVETKVFTAAEIEDED